MKSKKRSILHVRQRLALEQAALHTYRLHLDRWAGEHTPAQRQWADARLATPQSAWHAATQQHFLAWLEEGGFTRDDTLPVEISTPPLVEPQLLQLDMPVSVVLPTAGLPAQQEQPDATASTNENSGTAAAVFMPHCGT